jgi:hypothetical protein
VTAQKGEKWENFCALITVHLSNAESFTKLDDLKLESKNPRILELLLSIWINVYKNLQDSLAIMCLRIHTHTHTHTHTPYF